MAKGMRAILASAALAAVLSGGAEIKWLSKDYHFGTFKEASGPVTGSVKFVNLGPDATFISRVRPSCGCTGASYPTHMIEPGDTAEISFTYNPIGRPGRFNKTVRVYVGEDNELTTCRISGTVIGDTATLAAVFPASAGPLLMENPTLVAGDMKRGTTRHIYLNVYNQGADTISPTWKTPGEMIEVDMAPRRLPPGEIGTLSFTVISGKEKRNGPVEYTVMLDPDGDGPTEPKAVKVNAIIMANTDNMTVEEIEAGPRAYLVPEFVDFGDVDGSKPLDFEFGILNDGKSVMNVERVYSTESAVAVTKHPEKVKPGKTATVKGKLDPAALQTGPFRINVQVMTNDPLHPVRTASLVGMKAES